MGRKPTKALRGKRRWIGLHYDGHLPTRKDLQHRLDSVLRPLNLLHSTRLMDVLPAEGFKGDEWTAGKAILCVRLEDVVQVRKALEDPQSMEIHGIQCVTSSGKIRLVRERMELPRPKKRR